MLDRAQAERTRQAAACAWAALGGAPGEPVRIEPLLETGKSRVYRLGLQRRHHASVVAKRCRLEEAQVERTVYEDILPHVPVSRLEYHGFVADTDGEHAWLFVEDAGDERLGLQGPDGRRILTRWLATLHAAASQVPAIASLPERSAAHYLQHLHTARTMMRGNRDNPALQGADREVLDVILGQLDIVEAHWGELESACATMPRTLVHGDVTGKNLRLRRQGRSQTLVTFDWEMAGSGVPAPDLSLVQADLYASLVRDTWPDLDTPCIRLMGRIGKLFRGALAPISWASLSLQYAWVEHPMILLRLYEERLRESLRAAGWEH